MIWLAYILAVLVGLSLGLIGAGGSILTVPILVYIVKMDPVQATAYSLFVVGVIALFGAIMAARKRLVAFRTAVIFAFPSLVSVYLTRKLIVPMLPGHWAQIGSFELRSSNGLILIFSLLMLLAGRAMIRPIAVRKHPGRGLNFPFIFLEGIVVGCLSGLVGAGGGFLIIPALVLFGEIDMRLAVGTSLLIIAINSLLGFLGDVQNNVSIDWRFLLSYTLIAGVGMVVGRIAARRVPASGLKKGFGWFIVLLAIVIMMRELFFY